MGRVPTEQREQEHMDPAGPSGAAQPGLQEWEWQGSRSRSRSGSGTWADSAAGRLLTREQKDALAVQKLLLSQQREQEQQGLPRRNL